MRQKSEPPPLSSLRRLPSPSHSVCPPPHPLNAAWLGQCSTAQRARVSLSWGPFASQAPGLVQRVPVLFHLSPRGSRRVRSAPRRRRPTWQALERGSQVNLNVRSIDRLRSTDEKKVARVWSGTAFKVHSAPCQQSNSGTIQKDRSLGRSVGVSGGLIFTLAAAPRSARSPISARSTVVRSWLLLNKRRPNAS